MTRTHPGLLITCAGLIITWLCLRYSYESTYRKSLYEDHTLELSNDILHRYRKLLAFNESNSQYGRLEANTQLFPDKSVFGVVVMSIDKDELAIPEDSLTDEVSKRKRMLTLRRLDNVLALEAELPFNLTPWHGIQLSACPNFKHIRNHARGVAMAHYQIWHDFVYFDSDLASDIKHSNLSDSVNLTYHSYAVDGEGRAYKDGLLRRPKDVLVVFEDDAESVINDTKGTMREELAEMNNVDMIFLGWCEGRLARPHPLCAHAYAVTRAGAAKLLQYYEPCGRGIDEQLVALMNLEWLTYRRAWPCSYQTNYRPGYPTPRTKTYGMFEQKKYYLASLNDA